MYKYIDREAVCYQLDKQATIDGQPRAIRRARRIVENFPATELVERKTGKWILVKGSDGRDYHKCSECLHTQEITGVKNYCAVCGSYNGGDDDGA